MKRRLFFVALVVSLEASAISQQPDDQTQALSELSQMFYEDSATFSRDLLDRRKLDYSVESLKHIDEYLEAIRQKRDVEQTWTRTVLRAGAYVGEVRPAAGGAA